MARSALLDLIGDQWHLLVDHVPHSKAIGMTVVDVRPGEAWLEVPYAANLVGDPDTGVVHGGVITTLLDQCAGVAVMTALDGPRSIATLDLRIDYMKPATPGHDIRGWCHCYKTTRNIAFVRGVAYHDDRDDPIGSCVATFMLGANRSQPGAWDAKA